MGSGTLSSPLILIATLLNMAYQQLMRRRRRRPLSIYVHMYPLPLY
jgi:hypothetical protein